jgi:lipopolysaccharide exporter
MIRMRNYPMEPGLSVVPDPGRLVSRVRPYLGDGSSLLIILQATTSVLRLGSNLILTRLLVPEAFGIVAIVSSIWYVLVMLSDLGLRAYVTRHPTANDELVQTVWTIRFIRNVVLAAIMFVGAGFFANLYSAPEVSPAIRVASTFILLEGLTSLAFLTSERERRVIRLTLIDFVKFLFVSVITITAAYFLRNFWAIIIAMFMSSVFTLVASYTLVKGPPIRFRLHREHVLDLWRFCRVVIPSSIISIVLTQTDKFFLAKFFPLAELGKYMLAAALATTILTVIGEYVMRVFYPRFAQVVRETPGKAAEVYYASRRQVTLLLAFGAGGVIGGAELIIRILFNDNYLGAGFYLAILCLQPLARLSSEPAEQALVAKGFIRITLVANILRLVWVLAAAPIAYFQIGPLAVIVVMALTEVVMLPFFWWQLHRRGLLKVSEELFIFGAAAVGYMIGFIVDWAAHAAIDAGLIPAF